jgi:hypothetical protein
VTHEVTPPQMPRGAWHVAPAAAELRAFLESDAWRTSAKQIRHRPIRSVYRVPAAGSVPVNLYVKVNHPRGWLGRLKSIIRPKARIEFLQGRRLAEAGVAVAPAVAWARRGSVSVLVSSEIAGGEPFPVAWERAREQAPVRAAFLAGLAGFLRSLFACGVDHPDMHAGNILVHERDGRFSFSLVDLYGVRVGAPRRERLALRLLAWVLPILAPAARHEVLDCLRQCLPQADGRRAADLFRGLYRHRAHQARRRWRGRRYRLLEDSTLCGVETTATGLWHLLRPFPLPSAEAALAAHLGRGPGAAQRLKEGPKRCVSRVVADGNSFVVKEFRRAGPWGAWRADGRAWLNAYRLARVYAIPAAACRAWARTPDGRGFLILDDVGTRCLHDELASAANARERRPWLLAAARMTARLHRVHVQHGDLKQSNLMVTRSAGRPALVLVDLDSVRFRRRLSTAQRLRNLHQILDHAPACVTAVERLRFLVEYRLEAGMAHAELRRLLVRW